MVNRTHQPLAALPNLGPKSAQMLVDAGITSVAQLHALGAVAAYVQVCRHRGQQNLNLLWALEGALTGQPWQHVARYQRAELLLAADGLMNQP